jgi:hypothetical protein
MWMRFTLKEGNRPIWIWRSYQQDGSVRRSEADDATIISIGCGVYAVTEPLIAVLQLLGLKDVPIRCLSVATRGDVGAI